MASADSVLIPARQQDRDPVTGRWAPGNRVSRKHGLRALSAAELRPRHNRAGWVAKALLADLAEAGRQLKPWEEKRLRRWAELEVIADDSVRAFMDQGARRANSKLWEVYLSAVREQGRISAELGLTRATEERARESEQPSTSAIHHDLVARYGKPAVVEGK
jgi:hypothetical protein